MLFKDPLVVVQDGLLGGGVGRGVSAVCSSWEVCMYIGIQKCVMSYAHLFTICGKGFVAFNCVLTSQFLQWATL